MKRSTILLVLSSLLLVSIFVFIFFGCACWRKTKEGFADAKKKEPETKKNEEGDKPKEEKPKGLTPQEKELFEDLKNNKLSEDEVKTLVQNNILNQELVEKFLDQLSASDTLADEPTDVVEGFASVGNSFACANFGADQ